MQVSSCFPGLPQETVPQGALQVTVTEKFLVLHNILYSTTIRRQPITRCTIWLARCISTTSLATAITLASSWTCVRAAISSFPPIFIPAHSVEIFYFTPESILQSDQTQKLARCFSEFEKWFRPRAAEWWHPPRSHCIVLNAKQWYDIGVRYSTSFCESNWST